MSKHTRERLAASPIFSCLEDQDLDRLLDATSRVRALPGEVVFRRGDVGQHVLFVVSGSLEVEAECRERGALRLNLVKPGEVVGEMAALGDSRRTATVRALESCELLSIPQADFLGLLVGHPALAIRTLGLVADRLRSLTDAVASQDA